LSAATSTGVIIGPVLGSVARHFGTEVPGLVAAVLVLASAGFAWKWLPESRVRQAHSAEQLPPTRGRSVTVTLWEIIRRPGQAAHRIIWIYVVGMLALNVVVGVLALYLKDAYAVTEET